MTLRMGVDVGGTFTDVFLLKDGAVHRGKADTTHYDLKVGFMNAARAASRAAEMGLEEPLAAADAIVYSTTVGTNALIERKGSKLGLITTRGFEHTVHVGRSRNWADGMPPEMKYDRGRARRPVPIVAPGRIVGVQERIDNLGRVIIPLDEADARAKIQYLVDQGVRGFVVVTLNSFVNPAHERRIGEMIREQFPEAYLGHMPVYLSSEISPKAGEYRRSMTVILDAYLREISSEHLIRLTDDLREAGYRRPFFVAKNTGGLSSLSRTQALHLLGSSPSATVVGADHVGRQLGLENILIGDMGGTSFDVGLVVEGRERVYEYDPIIDRFRVQVPYVAHWSIGAGGGSIAGIEGGALKVGPESAGSNPGPACYARGGTRPTVTDADVVLGLIDPANFLGGRIVLDAERARRSVGEHIADPLGVSVEDAAWQIKRLVDGYMGQEMYRITALVSGEDPRQFTVFALGGAGPVHATGFASFADCRRIATFPFSSVFGAFSTLTYDIQQAYERTVYLTLLANGGKEYVEEGIAPFNAVAAELRALAERDMEEEGFGAGEIALQLEVQISYGQQRQTLPIPAPKARLDGRGDVKALCDAFNAAYAERFGKGSTYPEAGIEIVGLRLNAVGGVPKFALPRIAPMADPESARTGARPVYWGPEHGVRETPVYARERLGAGFQAEGPVLAEASDTVIVTPPGWRFRVDDHDVGWIERM